MHVPVPLLAAAAIVFLLLAWLAFRPRGRGDDLLGPPSGAPPSPRRARGPTAPAADPTLSPELEAEVRQLLRSGGKIEAIKRVRDATRMGLAEAKDLVERM